jgi:hypothetical protein
VLGGALVVGAVDQPAAFGHQRTREPVERVHRRHHPAGEEMAAHPVVVALGLEWIEQRAVREGVREQLASRPQPGVDALHEQAQVVHVLEHLDRHDPVEGLRGEFEHVDVAGQHAHVGETAVPALRLDVLALPARVGHGGDRCVREPFGHPQRQRTPAATELEDVLAVRQRGPLAVERQHRFLGLVQGFVAARVVARGVLHPRTEAQGEERRRQFVVLRVRGVGVHGQRSARMRGDALHEAFGLRRRPAFAFLPEPLRAQPADAATHQRVGDEATLGEAEQAGRGRARCAPGARDCVHADSFRGNQGKNIGVRRW